MKLLNRLGNLLFGKPKTAKYDAQPTYRWQSRDLPPFTFDVIRAMLIDPTVRLGLFARFGAVAGAKLGYRDRERWVPGVKAESREIAEFVQKTWSKFWSQDLEKIAASQTWGWSAGEIMYSLREDESGRKLVHYDKLLDRSAEDVQPLQIDGQLSGVRFRRIKDSDKGHVDLPLTKAIWMPYSPQAGGFYGQSVCLGCQDPWWDKWDNGGALEVRRRVMRKHSFSGERARYPAGTTNIDGKGEVLNRDIMREMVENMLAGAVVTMPSVYHPQSGKPLWDVEDAKPMPGLEFILQYPKDLDVGILRGLDVPDEVLIIETTGAWNGRSISWTAFMTGMTRYANAIYASFEPTLKNLVEWNFGPGDKFEAGLIPLNESIVMAMQSSDSSGGGTDAPSPRSSQPDSQGMALGREASRIVEAAELVERIRRRRELREK